MSEAQKQWPRTLGEVVDQVLSLMSDEDKELVKNTPKGDLIQFHLGWGMWIRNTWGLWAGNDELLNQCDPLPTMSRSFETKVTDSANLYA